MLHIQETHIMKPHAKDEFKFALAQKGLNGTEPRSKLFLKWLGDCFATDTVITRGSYI
jgi:hypothetical protein